MGQSLLPCMSIEGDTIMGLTDEIHVWSPTTLQLLVQLFKLCQLSLRFLRDPSLQLCCVSASSATTTTTGAPIATTPDGKITTTSAANFTFYNFVNILIVRPGFLSWKVENKNFSRSYNQITGKTAVMNNVNLYSFAALHWPIERGSCLVVKKLYDI